MSQQPLDLHRIIAAQRLAARRELPHEQFERLIREDLPALIEAVQERDARIAELGISRS